MRRYSLFCILNKGIASLNAYAQAHNSSSSITDTLLAEAHDEHLVTGFFDGAEKLLVKGSRMPRTSSWQKAFWSLLEDNLIHECDRRGLEGTSGAQAIFAPSSAGLERLREIALDKDVSVVLTQARWNPEPVHLDWPDPLMCWEVCQGQILGDILSENGAIIVDGAVLAEVGLYRLNSALCEVSDVDIASALESHPDLQSYQSLGRDSNGYPIPPDELFSSVGLPSAQLSNLVILDRLKVRAEYIGLGLGAQIISRLFLLYGQGGGLGVISPFPLQFGGGCLKASCEAYKAASDSLQRYYRRLGFSLHPSDPSLMVCDLARGPLARHTTRHERCYSEDIKSFRGISRVS